MTRHIGQSVCMNSYIISSVSTAKAFIVIHLILERLFAQFRLRQMVNSVQILLWTKIESIAILCKSTLLNGTWKRVTKFTLQAFIILFSSFVLSKCHKYICGFGLKVSHFFSYVRIYMDGDTHLMHFHIARRKQC